MNGFKTIKKQAEAEISESRSRFIASVFCVEDEAEVKRHINEVRNKYKAARHYCFAYRLKDGKKRFSDDGEPHGTAGSPILSVIERNDLFDVLVVVTRYFGGILLGTGGLARAYESAALSALAECGFCEKYPVIEFKMTLSYEEYNRLDLKKAKILDIRFDDKVTVVAAMRTEDMSMLNVEFEKISEYYINF